MTSSISTLAELVLARGAETGPAIRYLHAGATDEVYSGADLVGRAGRIAARLRAAGLAPGDRVLLMLVAQRDFVDTFFGAIFADLVPVPLFPPVFATKLPEFVARFRGIADDADARALVVSAEIAGPAAALAAAEAEDTRHAVQVLGPDVWSDEAADTAGIEPLLSSSRRGHELAFLQYTSGSTGSPKGVALSHDNVLHNVGAICQATGFNAADVGVSWLPLYHDMGLIGGLLSTLFAGAELISLSPLDFARHPIRWLKAIDTYRGTLSPAPNFAFRRCLQLKDDDIAGLDLSSWRIAFNGAEPVDERTLSAFADRFAGCGFRRSTLFPVYGLAEHTLAVTFPAPGTDPVVEVVERAALGAGEAVVVDDVTDAAGAVTVVGVGGPLPGVEVAIRDGAGAALADGRVGEIVVKSPSVMTGYFRNAAASAEAVVDGWLRTGDLGYVRDGVLFVTGRHKDIIIRAGRNYYPQDLEAAAVAVVGVRAGRAVAFGIDNDDNGNNNDGAEHVAVVVESSVDVDARAALAVAVANAVAGRVGFRPERVVVVEPHALPLTSSGKVQRRATRDRLLAGEL